MNEGESATDLEWYSIQNITTHKWYTLKYTQHLHVSQLLKLKNRLKYKNKTYYTYNNKYHE